MDLRRAEETLDVLVIGAGPAGTASAALLRRAGLAVRVVEATRFPRFVIGESLLPRAMDILDEARLLDAVRARDYQIKVGALFAHGDERATFNFSDQSSRGWTWTWQVPRADFDQTLARAVEAMGVPIDFGARVVDVDLDGEPRVTVEKADGTRADLRARFVVDASGYGRVLPRLLGLERPSTLPPRMALFTHVTGDTRPPGPDGGRTWICLHPRGAWLWIIPFSDGRTSIGAVGAPEFFAGYGGDDATRLRAIVDGEPNAADRLAAAEMEFTPQTLGGYSASVSRLSGKNFCLVGNTAEFLDPVFSSGVTLALESASRAARLIVRQLGGGVVDWERDYDAHMRRGIDVFRTFVERWYDGTVPQLFFGARQDGAVRAHLCAVLAGYVWDRGNPLVREHASLLPTVARLAASTA